MEKHAFEKLLAEVDAVDLDKLGGDDFRGTILNAERWSVYQQITAALLDAMDQNDRILRVLYLDKPDPAEESASVTVLLPQAIGLYGKVKEVFARAATMCDSMTVTTMQDKIRISFTVERIWAQ